jgi:hypothetical protein
MAYILSLPVAICIIAMFIDTFYGAHYGNN